MKKSTKTAFRIFLMAVPALLFSFSIETAKIPSLLVARTQAGETQSPGIIVRSLETTDSGYQKKHC